MWPDLVDIRSFLWKKPMKVVMTQLLLTQCLLHHCMMHTPVCILLLILSTQIFGRPDVRDEGPRTCITERMKVIYFQWLLREELTEDGLQDAFCFCLCASLLQSCSTLWPPWLLCPRNSRWEFWSELPPTYSSRPRDRTGSLTLQAGMHSLPSEKSGKACPLGWKSAKFWRPEPRGRFWDLHAMSFVFLRCDDIWPDSCGRNCRLSCLFEFLFSASGSLVNLTLGSTG